MNKIVQLIMRSKAAVYIAALLCLALWTCQVVYCKTGSDGLLSMLLCPIMGYLLLKMSRDFSLNDVRCTFPATLFFMGCAIAPQIVSSNNELLHLVLFPLACYLLLCTYRKHSAMGSYFVAFALLGIECLLSPPLLLLFPLLVFLCASIGSLRIRTFFAAIWGLLFPYWVVGGVLFLLGNTEPVGDYFGQILLFGAWDTLPNDYRLWFPLVWALLLALPGSVVALLNRAMKLQANVVFRFLIMAFALLLLSLVLFPFLYVSLLPCVLLFASLIGSVLFVKDGGRVQNIYFFILLVFWAASLFFVYGTT